MGFSENQCPKQFPWLGMVYATQKNGDDLWMLCDWVYQCLPHVHIMKKYNYTLVSSTMANENPINEHLRGNIIYKMD